MKETTIKALKRGEWFTLKPLEEPTEKQVYIRGDYDRETKKYFIEKWDNIGNGRMIKGTTKAYTEFTF